VGISFKRVLFSLYKIVDFWSFVAFWGIVAFVPLTILAEMWDFAIWVQPKKYKKYKQG